MAVDNIKRTIDGYELLGTTNMGRPVTIQLVFGSTRNIADISVEPFPGAPLEEPYAEIELQKVMAEHDAIYTRISAVFEMADPDSQDEVILASIAAVISRQKLSPHVIEQFLFDNEQRMSM